MTPAAGSFWSEKVIVVYIYTIVYLYFFFLSAGQEEGKKKIRSRILCWRGIFFYCIVSNNAVCLVFFVCREGFVEIQIQKKIGTRYTAEWRTRCAVHSSKPDFRFQNSPLNVYTCDVGGGRGKERRGVV